MTCVWRTGGRAGQPTSSAPASSALWSSTVGLTTGTRWITGQRRGAFGRFRLNFEDIGAIDDRVKQARFVDNAEAIFGWGGIRNLGKLNEWRSLPPAGLQALIEDIRSRLDPETADTAALADFRYMGSGFSKVYSVLIDGFPIYDSRVACALNCLVGIYCQREKVGPKPDVLKLRLPPRQIPKTVRYHRCDRPRMNNDSAAYARDNLKVAWLLQEMASEPGEFGQVE